MQVGNILMKVLVKWIIVKSI